LDLSRVHFLGKVSHSAFVKVLQVSRVHVYLTYPFVLSWSMLEAMSAGCLIVGSRTPPVEEVLRDCGNGVLVDFFAHTEVADRVIEALEDPHAHDSIRRNARETVLDEYDLQSRCLPAHLSLIRTLSQRSKPLSHSSRLSASIAAARPTATDAGCLPPSYHALALARHEAPRRANVDQEPHGPTRE